MVLNTILRFWWLLAFFQIGHRDEDGSHHDSFSEKTRNIELLIFLSMVAEAVRRSVWSCIRVENEFFNNFEAYRNILVIPPIKDDDDAQE